jgi:hypothetical protein
MEIPLSEGADGREAVFKAPFEIDTTRLVEVTDGHGHIAEAEAEVDRLN